MKRITVTLTVTEYLKTVAALETYRDHLDQAGDRAGARLVDSLRCKFGANAQQA